MICCNKVEFNLSGDGAQICSDPPMSQQRFGGKNYRPRCSGAAKERAPIDPLITSR